MMEKLHEVGEGPFYKSGSPERKAIAEKGTVGDKLVVQGKVFNTQGNPIAGAWLDFWHADGNGEYDNVHYNLRGHQYTDSAGRYHLETVKPVMYGSRTAHIHVKVRVKPDSPVITSQLFFPGEERNATDPLFDPALLLKISETPDGRYGKFDFVL